MASIVTSIIQERLDAFVGGQVRPEAFLSELTGLCTPKSDTTWEVLALLDQYHRRGKLSAETHRAIRRQIEFPALGIMNPDSGIKPPEPVLEVADDEVDRLRAELENERHRAQRYRHRIETLAEYGRRQRATSRSRALVVVPQVAQVAQGAPTRFAGRDLVAWFPRGRRFQRPHIGSSAAVMLAAATTIIAGSSATFDIAPNLVAATGALINAGPVPELQVSPIPEPPTISLAEEKFLVLPGYTLATIQVQRTGGGHGPVKFTWWTQSAGAKAGKDYAFGKRRVAQIEAGEESVKLNVRILANPQRKHTELFFVEIGEPGNDASIGEIRRAPVFIMRSGMGS